MEFEFNCYGHENILATHPTTLEFTKDPNLTKKGDCIIGVKADFDFHKLRNFVEINKDKRIICEISIDSLKDNFTFSLNQNFSDKEEIVIRKSDFKSNRTLGINANKAAADIDRNLVHKLKDNVKMTVILNRLI